MHFIFLRFLYDLDISHFIHLFCFLFVILFSTFLSFQHLSHFKRMFRAPLEHVSFSFHLHDANSFGIVYFCFDNSKTTVAEDAGQAAGVEEAFRS